MSKHRGTKFYDFLCLLSTTEQRIDDIATDLYQLKGNVHKHIREAERAGIKFIKTRANGGLYSIRMDGQSKELLSLCIDSLRKRFYE